MNLETILVPSIRQAVGEVFSTMLGVEIVEGETSIENGVPEANDGVVSFIGVAGSWAGTGSLTCSPALACRICTHMLLTESTSVNEEVLDAVAELTNMIIGCVKTDLERHLGPLGLSIPTVVFGKNFKTRSSGHAEWTVMRFHWLEEVLLVKFCLAPNARLQPLMHQPSVAACHLDV
jgi:chemotaxis protein CheX